MSKLLPELMCKAVGVLGAGIIGAAILAACSPRSEAAELIKLVDAADGSGGAISYLEGSAEINKKGTAVSGIFSMSGQGGVMNVAAGIGRDECERGSGVLYLQPLGQSAMAHYNWLRGDGSFGDAAAAVLCTALKRGANKSRF